MLYRRHLQDGGYHCLPGNGIRPILPNEGNQKLSYIKQQLKPFHPREQFEEIGLYAPPYREGTGVGLHYENTRSELR